VKISHRIRVLGREIQVRSSSSVESVLEVEAYINQRLAEVAASIPSADQQLVTLLTLLNITESYLGLRNSGTSGEPDQRGTVDRIMQKIDKALE